MAHGEAGGEEEGGEGKGRGFGGGGLFLFGTRPRCATGNGQKMQWPDAAKMRSARQLLRDGLGSGSMVREGSAERCAE